MEALGIPGAQDNALIKKQDKIEELHVDKMGWCYKKCKFNLKAMFSDKRPGFFEGEPKYRPNLMLVQASSAGYDSGNFAKIMINNELISMDPNEHDHYRGLHIVIINP